MSPVVPGLIGGIGALLCLSAAVGAPPVRPAAPAWARRWGDMVRRADLPGMDGPRLVLVCLACALLALVASFVVTETWAVGLAMGVVAAPLPAAWVSSRSHRRAREAREAWPEVVDSLVSGVRAGAALPTLLADLGSGGPPALRGAFEAFGQDYRAHGRFDVALDRLKDRLADPVADRIVEALRLARSVGGADLARLLTDLAVLLREDARVRGELEARQSWTVGAARLGVAAPWVVLLLISQGARSARVWNTPQGMAVLALGGACCVAAYALMRVLSRLSTDPRTMR